MAEYLIPTNTDWTTFDIATGAFDGRSFNGLDITVSDGNLLDNELAVGEALTWSFGSTVETTQFLGTVNIGGTQYPVFRDVGDGVDRVVGIHLSNATYPNFSDLGGLNTSPLTVDFCFAPGTEIATPDGFKLVEAVQIGDLISRAEGGATAVKWIGRQSQHKLLAGIRLQPVRIRAGALGDGLPHRDLTVTADHGMVFTSSSEAVGDNNGFVINASALINGSSIDWVPMEELPDSVTYYHIETEAHDVILANGAPAETFIDVAGRAAFDNYQEYLDLYGAERIIPEMRTYRLTMQRLLPQSIKARLGIERKILDMAQIA